MTLGVEGKKISLDIAGLGILLYSPALAPPIAPGTDFLDHFMDEADVQPYIQAGTLVAFGTGGPGSYHLAFHEGYPVDDEPPVPQFWLRLGLKVAESTVCARDLFDLIQWDPKCPRDQVIEIPDGIYHVTLRSRLPKSGIVGDDQRIDVYLQPLDTFPALTKNGIPALTWVE